MLASHADGKTYLEALEVIQAMQTEAGGVKRQLFSVKVAGVKIEIAAEELPLVELSLGAV